MHKTKWKKNNPHPELLLFRMAFPASKQEWEDASSKMAALNRSGEKEIAFTGLTGFRGSVIRGSFSFSLTRWLVDQFPDDVEISSSQADPESIRLLFHSILPRTEFDLIAAGELELLNRIRLIKGINRGRALAWLIGLIDKNFKDERVKETIFNGLGIFIRWQIRHPDYNLAALRFETSNIFPFKKRSSSISFKNILVKRLPDPVELSFPEKTRLINMARCSLAFLYRETDPFTHACPEDLTYFNLGGGLSIALFAMEGDRKLSIESYIGYLALMNGIPVAYGGGWIFGIRCQFGINIFPAFRGAGSALLLANLLRVYQQYFKVSQFFIKPYQFGKNNPEALRSGAYWFYHKAGFRSLDKLPASLAAEELRKKKNNPAYRSPVPVLKKLADSMMFFQYPGKRKPVFDAARLSRHCTQFINRVYGGDREQAVLSCRKKTAAALGLRNGSGFDRLAKRAFEEWSLIIQSSLNLGHWSPKQKATLLDIIRQRSLYPEKKYVIQLQNASRLWKDWNRLFHQ